MYRVAVDTGGTFTDIIVSSDDGVLEYAKVPTTDDLEICLTLGLEKAASRLQLNLPQFLSEIDLVVYGTTSGTNALLTRTGVTVGLITTKGFEDILYFRQGWRAGATIYDYTVPYVRPLVPGYWRFGVDERVLWDGEVQTPLNEVEVVDALQRMKAGGVESVAICFLHSYANSTHEDRVAEICRTEFPEAYVIKSSEVLPNIREYERFSSTLISGYIGPRVVRFLSRVEKSLEGLKGSMVIMTANGGVQTAEEVSKRAGLILNSGPSAGPVAALSVADAVKGENRNLISTDMGGTSFDVSCIISRHIPTTSTQVFDGEVIGFKMVDCITMGAGGGSVIWFDRLGMLRVGPKSAGANPGPVCYGKGGSEVTVSDADLLLGYLSPECFLGGEIALDMDASKKAMAKLASRMELNPTEASYSVYRLANTNMANKILEYMVERGHDPRDFTLVAGGGAGPVHMVDTARRLGVKKVIVPKFAALYCATGMMFADLTHDFVRPYTVELNAANLEDLNQLYEKMAFEGIERLKREGVASESISIVQTADMRYVGQFREIEVPIPSGKLDESKRAELKGTFDKKHEELLLFSTPKNPVQFISLRLKAIGTMPNPHLKPISTGDSDPSSAIKSERECNFGKPTQVVTPVYDSERLLAGNIIKGPSIIEEKTTTVVLPPLCHCTVGAFGDYVIEID
ncbi:MAG: hydantoinase/oxoprolinase family protein [Acidobacteriota bacterium]|nr:hydantoinase/oxoprolinase family protein [Acidobacteriota bacterium]